MSSSRALTVAAVLAAAGLCAAQAPTINSTCLGQIRWSNFTITPAIPQAGDTLVLNATGVMAGIVGGGAGEIDAFLFGSEM